jgi:hypothetical protein
MCWILAGEELQTTEYYTEVHLHIAFCVSSIRHDSSLSKYRKQKQSPLEILKMAHIQGSVCFFAEWRIMTNKAYAKSNGDGLLCSILCPNWPFRCSCALWPDTSRKIPSVSYPLTWSGWAACFVIQLDSQLQVRIIGKPHIRLIL